MIDAAAMAQTLEAAGLGVFKKTIFLEGMPAELDRGLMLRAGHLPTPIDHELPGYFKAKIQIIARARSKKDAFDLAWAAAQALDKGARELGTMNVRHIRASHLPLTFPASDGNMIEGSVNLDLCFSNRPI